MPPTFTSTVATGVSQATDDDAGLSREMEDRARANLRLTTASSCGKIDDVERAQVPACGATRAASPDERSSITVTA